MSQWKCIKCGYEDNAGNACKICGASRKLADKNEDKPDFGNVKGKQRFVTND